MQGCKTTAMESDTNVSASTAPASMENPLTKKRRMNWENSLCEDNRNTNIVVAANNGSNSGNGGGGIPQANQELGKDNSLNDRRKGKCAQSLIKVTALSTRVWYLCDNDGDDDER